MSGSGRLSWWMMRVAAWMPDAAGSSARAAVSTAKEFIACAKEGQGASLNYVPDHIMAHHRSAAIGHILRTLDNAPGYLAVTLPTVLYDPTATPEKVAAMREAYEITGSFVRAGIELIGPEDAAIEDRYRLILRAAFKLDNIPLKVGDDDDWRHQPPGSTFVKLYKALCDAEPGEWDRDALTWRMKKPANATEPHGTA